MTSGRYPIIVATLAILLVAAAATTAILHSMWRDAIHDAEVAVGNVAAILSEQTFQSVRAVDLVASDVAAHVVPRRIESPVDLDDDVAGVAQHEMLVDWLKRLPQIKVIEIVDAAGISVASTHGWPTPAVDVSARDPFEYLRTHRDLSLAVGVPVRDNGDGDWTVYFSRRLENGAGEFLGTVAIGVAPDFFLHIAEGASALKGYRARLVREDGTIYVANPSEVSQLGVKVVEAPEWQALVAKGGGTFRTGERPDGEPRLVAVSPVVDYPLVVDVSLDEASMTALWRQRALIIALVSAVLAFGVAALVASLIVQFRRAMEREEQVRDREERLAREARRREMADVRFETAIGHMRQGIAVFDASYRLVTCNTAFLEMYGMTAAQAPPGTPLETILRIRVANGTYSGDDPEKYVQDRLDLVANPEKPDTTDVQRIKNGRYFRTFKQHLPEGGWVTIHEDVTERENALSELRFLARHDPLTGLANRALLFEQLKAVHRDETWREHAALLLIDLDGFKSVNDKFGHGVGDTLLKAVADRFRTNLAETDTLARLGGDEFAILRPREEGSTPALVALAERILETFQEPFAIAPHLLKVGASIGIATEWGRLPSPDAALRQADLALYRAKSDGRNRVAVFEPAMEIAITYRRDLARDLDAALDAGTIHVDYQPIVDAETGRAVAMEALARWRHPTVGPVPASTFVAIAEEFGLIHRLSDAVMGQACLAAASWPPTVRIAVNVSALQVAHGDLPAVVRQHLENAGLSAARIELEITESALLADESRVRESLQAIRAMGVQIVLDDFGTGFASLSNLNAFAVDRIKIDRSFIAQLGTHRGSTAIVEASTMIAEAFRVEVTAEGVETEEQSEMLRRLGVHHLQGYLIARPAPREAWSFVDGKAVRRSKPLLDFPANT